MSMARFVAPMRGRIELMIGRAVITFVNDSLKAQGVQIEALADEVHDDVEHFQHYGYTSVPLAGAEAVVAFLGGLRSHGVVIATVDRRHRLLNLAPGEVAIHDDLGQKVHLTRDGIVIETELPITINGEAIDITVTGSASVSAQSVDVTADSVAIDSDSITLAGGGAAVARVGDTVNLTTGEIETGSAKVQAG